MLVGLVTGWIGILPVQTGWGEAVDGSVAEAAEQLEAALAAPMLLDETEAEGVHDLVEMRTIDRPSSARWRTARPGRRNRTAPVTAA